LTVLVIDHEPTANRAFSKAFCQHADMLGTDDPANHADRLDLVWQQLEKSDPASAASNFPENVAEELLSPAGQCPVHKRRAPRLRPGLLNY